MELTHNQFHPPSLASLMYNLEGSIQDKVKNSKALYYNLIPVLGLGA